MYQQGDIVYVNFPFTDLTSTKKRPALILSNDQANSQGDYLLCQITSRAKKDNLSIQIQDDDYVGNSLPVTSYVRVHKIFCLHDRLIDKKLCAVTVDFSRKVNTIIQDIIKR